MRRSKVLEARDEALGPACVGTGRPTPSHQKRHSVEHSLYYVSRSTRRKTPPRRKPSADRKATGIDRNREEADVCASGSFCRVCGRGRRCGLAEAGGRVGGVVREGLRDEGSFMPSSGSSARPFLGYDTLVVTPPSKSSRRGSEAETCSAVEVGPDIGASARASP